MYFTNIANPELQYYKGRYARNFSISLTDLLESSLFKVEEIAEDSIYKIYPLFNSKSVSSSHSKDKILSPYCIIAIKQESHETYFRFISNDAEVIAYNEIFEGHAINDRLSVSEFNAIVQQFRSNYQFTEEININNSSVDGIYGNYLFNLESTTIVDTGVLITRETLENIGTVRLINPVFKYSTYTLILKVYSVEDINIGLNSRNNIEVTTLEVELTEDTDVKIPFETLNLNNIVGFDATVNIVHNKPVIQYPLGLTLSASSYNPVLGKITVLTCKYTDETGAPISDEEITFKTLEGVVLGTATTDNEGYASFDYTPITTGDIVIYCVDNYSNASNQIELNRILQSSSITLSTDKSLVYVPAEFTVSGTLIIDGEPANNVDVGLYNGNVLLYTLSTDSNGVFSKTISQSSVTNYQFQVRYGGDEYIESCNSSYVAVTCRKLNTSLSIATDKSTVYYTQSVSITGKLTDELNNNVTGATVKLYNGNTQIATATTNSNGVYSFTRTWSIGSYSFKVVYEGDNRRNSVTSDVKNVTMSKAPTSVNIIADKTSYYAGDTVLIKVNSNYGTFNPSSVRVVFNGATTTVSTKDSSGNFVFTIPAALEEGNYTLSASYAGDSNYAASSNSKTIPIRLPDNTVLSLTYANEVFTINFKANGVNLSNILVKNLNLQIMNPRRSIDFADDYTDNNGNLTYKITGISSYHGTAYAVFEKYDETSITSNTVSY